MFHNDNILNFISFFLSLQPANTRIDLLTRWVDEWEGAQKGRFSHAEKYSKFTIGKEVRIVIK